MPFSHKDRGVLRFCPNPQAQLRLFCLPYAGGGASIFRTWSALLPPTIDLCAIQAPGRESRLSEPPLTRLTDLVQVLTKAIIPYCALPFAIFGHSLGALVGYELIRQFRREGHPGPLQLFVSGRVAPQLADSSRPIHQLPDAEFVRELKRYNGTPDEILHHEELMQLLLPLLRADFAMHETYTYVAEDPLDCPITAFGGVQDPAVSRDQLTAWQAQTHQMFSLHMMPGDHFFIHSARGLLLQELSRHLKQLSCNLLNGVSH